MVQATEKYYLEQIRVLELEKGKALVRVTELEMALDFERAKMMGQG
jgi:hypothetical protein